MKVHVPVRCWSAYFWTGVILRILVGACHTSCLLKMCRHTKFGDPKYYSEEHTGNDPEKFLMQQNVKVVKFKM